MFILLCVLRILSLLTLTWYVLLMHPILLCIVLTFPARSLISTIIVLATLNEYRNIMCVVQVPWKLILVYVGYTGV
jgi:hypothetical protein